MAAMTSWRKRINGMAKMAMAASVNKRRNIGSWRHGERNGVTMASSRIRQQMTALIEKAACSSVKHRNGVMISGEAAAGNQRISHRSGGSGISSGSVDISAATKRAARHHRCRVALLDVARRVRMTARRDGNNDAHHRLNAHHIKRIAYHNIGARMVTYRAYMHRM